MNGNEALESDLSNINDSVERPGLDLKVTFPEVEGSTPSQDQEFCIVEIDGARRKVRFHDYDEIYNIPGLYEKIFYDKLDCQSPTLMGRLLDHEVSRQGIEMEELTVLDVGAGNGIMGEVLNDAGVDAVVGVDILSEAAEAARRDRPGVYDAYYPVDLLHLSEPVEQALEKRHFNCMTLIAALGFGDIPPSVFATAYNLVDDGGFIAFNIKEEFLDEATSSGFSSLIRRMEENGWMDMALQVRYVHRLNMLGEPLHYTGIIGRKRHDIPEEVMASQLAH